MRASGIAILTIAAAISTFAQSAGSITGTVYDRLGRKINGVPVEIKNTQTGATYSASTDSMGEYTLSLPTGTYTLTMEVAGRKYSQDSVVIVPQHPLRHDVTFALP